MAVFAQRGVPRDVFEKVADAAVVRLGSVCHPQARVRAKAVAHLLECVEVMDAVGSADLKLWFADGTNYPGQDDIGGRQDRLAECLAEVYARLGAGQRLLLEYKLFEPAFYHSDVPDWGTALLHCLALGDRARVVVDTGHHAPGTNIEFIVAVLLRERRLGAFDFNSRFYADDDLMVGAADPFQLFRIMHQVVAAGGLRPAAGVNFMLDQCHNIEPKIPAQIRSVMNVQEATAKALLADLSADLGLDPDPVAAYHRSGYQQHIETDRVGGTQAGWGA
jgi:L-rhamnose isomerase / sugar isomerase